MELQYVYQKERREFGRQCLFSDRNKIEFSEASNHDLFKNYILKDPVDVGTQISKQYALSEVNTTSAEYECHGVTHSEGGWPKDVNYLDPEHTVRMTNSIRIFQSL